MAAKSRKQEEVSHLASSSVNLLALRQHTRDELTSLLTQAGGAGIALVFDPDLLDPLHPVCEVDLLRAHGVEDIHKLLPQTLDTEQPTIVYLLRPSPALMKMVARQIHAHAESGQRKRYHLFFVPRKTLLCERVLAAQGVFGDLKIDEFHLDLIPFERDLLSLEMPSSFRSVFLEGDPTSLFFIARSLMKLQSMFGLFPTVQGIGAQALQIFTLMRRMRTEMPEDAFSSQVPEIDRLVVLDRAVDMVTPLMTQLTYEGLVDETIGVEHGLVEVDTEVAVGQKMTEVLRQRNQYTPKRKIPFNSSDTILSDIRDVNFKGVGPILHRKAQEIKSTYSKKETAYKEDVQQFKHFFEEFKSANREHNFLQCHIAIADMISKATFKKPKFMRRLEQETAIITHESDCHEYIRDHIAKEAPFIEVARLLVMVSLTHGIKAKHLDTYRREIIQTYGYEMMTTLHNFEKMGLLVPMQERPPWPTLCRALDLLHPGANARQPTDADFCFSGGYVPLSVRLAQYASSPGWNTSPLADQLGLLAPHKVFNFQQPLPTSIEERMRIGGKDVPRDKKKIVLVFFVGGVTLAEISALRWLSEQESHPCEYLIATTHVCNGNSILRALYEPMPAGIHDVAP